MRDSLFRRYLISKARAALLGTLVLVSMSYHSAASDTGPDSEFGFEEASREIVLELVRLFLPRERGIVGRFKLVNGGKEILSISGTRSVADVISIEPSPDVTSNTTFHRTLKSSGAEWIGMAKPLSQTNAHPESIEIYPEQIQYLDIVLPHSPAYFENEWLVQVVVSVSGKSKYLNSAPFRVHDDLHNG